jgi:hypothetical protein
MDREDVLLEAANRTISNIDHDGFAKLIRSGIEMCGKQLLSHIEDTDQGGLFTPVEVLVDRKWEQGCLLTLQDRAVIAWFKGRLNIQHFSQVIAFTDIQEVSVVRVEPPTWRLPERVTLDFDGANPAVIRIPRPEPGWNLPAMVEGVLGGGVTFE